MCGFSGAVFTSSSSFIKNSNFKENFYFHASKLNHRGNEQMRKLEFEHLLLSHFRLAFVDIMSNLQPMISTNKKWVIVFNGEIYNHQALRKKISANSKYEFLTKSDTETILAGFINYGLEIKNHIEGEFSIVICSTDGSEIIALRDPFGVKPLFLALENVQTNIFALAKELYSFQTKSIQFSSEIKGLSINKKWNREGFLRQFVGLYEPIRTPFENIIQLPPNSILHAKKQENFFNVNIHLTKSPIRSLNTSNEVNLNNLYDEFTDSFQKSVEHRMIAEVELGIYLSGGIDSKAVAFESSKYHSKIKPNQNLKSFTISFEQEEYSETSEALNFANQLGLKPNILKVNNENLIYSYKHATYYSENVQPYTNGAGKWWLSRFAGKQVKGVLTGDGADELLCGYPSFRYANWWKFALNNRPGKNVFDKLKNLPLGNNWRDSIYLKKFTYDNKNPWLAGSSAEGTGIDFVESLKNWGVPHPLYSQIETITIALLGPEEAAQWLIKQKESVSSWFSFGLNESPEFLHNPKNTLLLWQNYFCKTHLPVQILNWVGDRMEMANTVEGRTPFLSKEMSDITSKLKDYMLIKGFEDKSILRRSYQKKMGHNFVMTPKKQFGTPFLFQGNNLKSYLEKILLKANESNLFDAQYASKLYNILNEESSKETYSSHTLTHLYSAFQTLICFCNIDDFIIQGNIPIRDINFEENVIQSQKII